jgi:hypothetical protein
MYRNIQDEEQMSDSPGQKRTVRSQVIHLISKLSNNSNRILKERHNNQKPPKGGEVSATSVQLPGEGTA